MLDRRTASNGGAQADFLHFLPVLPPHIPPEVVDSIRAAALHAYLEQGASAFAATREETTNHEAGHAIVGTAEGIKIRSISIFQQSMPGVGQVWTGRCIEEASTWSSGPNTTAEDDLGRARFILAGYMAERLTGHDRAGSSLDEIMLSQFVFTNAAVKLGDPPLRDEAALFAYRKELYTKEVWGVTQEILRANHEPCKQLAEYLYQHKHVRGQTLDKVLAQVERRKS
jgi:hypothetical protein